MTTSATQGGSRHFSPARFNAYMRCYAASNSRKLILAAAAIFILWFIIAIIPVLVSNFSLYREMLVDSYRDEYTRDPMWEVEGMFGMIALAVLMTIAGSMVFSGMHGRGERQTLLTLPVSNLEKFITWFLVYIVGALVVYMVSFYVCDVLRVMCVKMFTPAGAYAHVLPIWKMMIFCVQNSFPGIHEWIMLLCLIYGMILLGSSFFALGSIIWQKASYLKTFVGLAALNTIVSAVTTWSWFMFHGSAASVEPVIHIDFELGWPLTLGCIGVTVGVLYFMFWLGYRRFRDTDLVERW